MKKIIAQILGCSLIAISAPAAVVVCNFLEPSEKVQLSNPIHTNNYGFDADECTTLGQSFYTAETGFNLTGITVQKGSAQRYAAGNGLTVHFFAWSPGGNANSMAGWRGGDGAADHDPLNGTGMNELYTETFALGAGVIEGEQYMHFKLTTPVELSAQTAYGFVIEFRYGGKGADNMNLRQASAGNPYAAGVRVSTTADSNVGGEQTDLAFYVLGTGGVSEPETLGLLLF